MTAKALTFLFLDSSILAVGQGTGGTVAQASDIKLIPAEVLCFCPANKRLEMNHCSLCFMHSRLTLIHISKC